jgi:hypothetical protein
MMKAPWNSPLVAALALLCMAPAARAQASSTWGGPGGASSWQAGTAKSSSAAPASIATGSQSAWNAGKGSVTAHGEPGGVWSDGTSLPASPTRMPGAGNAAMSGSTNGQVGSSIGRFALPAPVGLSHLGAAPGKTQVAARSGGLHTTTGVGAKGAAGPHLGVARTSVGVHRTSGRRTSGAARRAQLGARSGGSNHEGTSPSSLTPSGLNPSSQGLESPLQNDPVLRELNGNTPGSELQSPLENSSH